MKKRRFLLATMFALALGSCSGVVIGPCDGPNQSLGDSVSRVYEAFGPYSATQVKEICKTFAARRGNGCTPDRIYLEYGELGYFGKVHVNIVKYDAVGNGYEYPAVETVASCCGYYICDFPSELYYLNAWIEGEGSFDLTDLYINGTITDENMRSIVEEANRLHIRENKTLDIELDDFCFTLDWGCGPDNHYQSDSGTIERHGREHVYDATFYYPNIEGLFEKIKALDMGSYPSRFNPYQRWDGMICSQNPVYYCQLAVGDMSIRLEGLTPRGNFDDYLPQCKKILELVYEIKTTIEGSDAWGTITIPEDDVVLYY